MSAPFFPNVEQLLDILFSELPDGVYATDRADDPDPSKRSNSSSELRAHCMMLAQLYANLQTIDLDKSATTVTPSGIGRWEGDFFSSPPDTSIGFAARQARLIQKIRANQGISFPAIYNIIFNLLNPLGLAFDLVPHNCGNPGNFTGVWILGVSILSYDTYLGLLDPLIGAGRGAGITPLDCNLDYAAAGLTADQLLMIQQTAYTYEVRIYGTADAATLATLDSLLTEFEPARSTHIITNNASPPGTPGDPGTELWNYNYIYWWIP